MKKPWFFTSQCLNGHCCRSCRTDLAFRKDLRANYDGIDSDDFACPWDVKELESGVRPKPVLKAWSIARCIDKYEQALLEPDVKDCDKKFFQDQIDQLTERLCQTKTTA